VPPAAEGREGERVPGERRAGLGRALGVDAPERLAEAAARQDDAQPLEHQSQRLRAERPVLVDVHGVPRRRQRAVVACADVARDPAVLVLPPRALLGGRPLVQPGEQHRNRLATEIG
jgi:hypothetical protein